eukprot:1210175-Ditylum_brightwellii.AAC.2
MALRWGAYRPRPFNDSDNVTRTTEWWGRLGTFVSVWRNLLVVLLIWLYHDNHWHVEWSMLKEAFGVGLECSLWVGHGLKE